MTKTSSKQPIYYFWENGETMIEKLDTSKLEAHLVASPTGLALLLDAVETALASIEGRASVELVTPDGERFLLQIIRKVDNG